jgi:hypothetical protein
MRYLILTIFLLTFFTNPLYAKNPTCKEILKNDFALIMTEVLFWNIYRGYIFGKSGEKIDKSEKVISKRISKYIKSVCKEDKNISVNEEMLYKGLEDDFKGLEDNSYDEKLPINFFLLHVDKDFKPDLVMKCSIENLNIDTIKLIEEKLPELEKLRESSGKSYYGKNMVKKVFGKSPDELLNFDNLVEKCGQYM